MALFDNEHWGSDQKTDALITDLFASPADSVIKQNSKKKEKAVKTKENISNLKKKKNNSAIKNSEVTSLHSRHKSEDVTKIKQKKTDIEEISPLHVKKIKQNKMKKRDHKHHQKISPLHGKKVKQKKTRDHQETSAPYVKKLKLKKKMIKDKEHISTNDSTDKPFTNEQLSQTTEIVKNGMRKRKMNSKKNKYKHLALARNIDKGEATVVDCDHLKMNQRNEDNTENNLTPGKKWSCEKGSVKIGHNTSMNLNIVTMVSDTKNSNEDENHSLLSKSKKKEKKRKRENNESLNDETTSTIICSFSKSKTRKQNSTDLTVNKNSHKAVVGENNVQGNTRKKSKANNLDDSVIKVQKDQPKSAHFNIGRLQNELSKSKIIRSTNEKISDESLVDLSPGTISARPAKKKRVRERDLPLVERMKGRLEGAHFRYLNEQLYTRTGKDAMELFVDDKEAFDIYHRGFQTQVEKWPSNPVDKVINYIKDRPVSYQVVDFGCGDAQIARSVDNKVYSFDLVALNHYVRVCDITHVPLANENVNIGVFCLSLMGTNLTDYIVEANRVIKIGGTLVIAEVISRFEKVGVFVRKMERLGFSLKQKDDSNKMFIWLEFRKEAPVNLSKIPEIKLLPCIYKRR